MVPLAHPFLLCKYIMDLNYWKIGKLECCVTLTDSHPFIAVWRQQEHKQIKKRDHCTGDDEVHGVVQRLSLEPDGVGDVVVGVRAAGVHNGVEFSWRLHKLPLRAGLVI